jgi:hypothetical protein
MRQLQMLAMAGLATVVVACSSSGTVQEPTTTTGPTTTVAKSTSAAAPSTIPANPAPGSDPAVLHKQIGEHAYAGCPDNSDGQCDIDFVVTSIQSGVPCVDDDPIDPDQQLVRIDVDVTTPQKLLYPDTTSTALYFANWGIGDASGVVPELDPYFGKANHCISDQGLTGLLPGTHVKVSWLVKAPKSSTVLRLYNSKNGDGWTWDVPPSG